MLLRYTPTKSTKRLLDVAVTRGQESIRIFFYGKYLRVAANNFVAVGKLTTADSLLRSRVLLFGGGCS